MEIILVMSYLFIMDDKAVDITRPASLHCDSILFKSAWAKSFVFTTHVTSGLLIIKQ